LVRTGLRLAQCVNQVLPSGVDIGLLVLLLHQPLPQVCDVFPTDNVHRSLLLIHIRLEVQLLETGLEKRAKVALDPFKRAAFAMLAFDLTKDQELQVVQFLLRK